MQKAVTQNFWFIWSGWGSRIAFPKKNFQVLVQQPYFENHWYNDQTYLEYINGNTYGSIQRKNRERDTETKK